MRMVMMAKTRWIAALGLLAVSCSRDVSLPAPVPTSISGRVIAEEPGTGRTIPASGARLEWVGTGLATTADPQTGRFKFEQVPPAPRTLWVQWSSQGDGELDRQRILAGGQVDDPGEVELGDIQVAANGQVEGRVVLADKPDDTAAQSGTVVFVQRYPYAAVAVPGGAFFLPRLPPGTLSLGFFRPGYAPASLSGVAVGAGTSIALQAVSLTPLPPDAGVGAGSLHGTVYGIDGTPSVGAKVTATASKQQAAPSGTEPFALTGADGTFDFSNLEPGPYLLSVRAAQGPGQSVLGGVLVLPDQTAEVGVIALSDAPVTIVEPSTPPPLPVANAGADQTVVPSSSVLLDGSASAGSGLIFHWRQTGGTPVVLALNDSAIALHDSFVAPLASQTLTFSLVVEDAFAQLSVASTVRVVVNAPASAQLTATPASVPAGATVTLDASASSDPEGDPLRVGFVQTSGPPVALSTSLAQPLQATFVPTVEAVYGFQAVVDDGHTQTLSAPATVSVSSGNHVPVPRITLVNRTHPSGPVLPGDDLLLDASASSDPDVGQTLSFQWKLNGSAYDCSGTCATFPLFAPSGAGLYRVRLTAIDDGSPSLSATAELAFRVSASIASTVPGAGETGVSPLSEVDIGYTALLAPATLGSTALSVSSGGVPLSGATRYASLAGAGHLIWTPTVPLPDNATIDVSVPSATDAYGQPTPTASFSFDTGALGWRDRSPLNPGYLDSDSGLLVDYSMYPAGPALATGPLGSFLAWPELYPSQGTARKEGPTWNSSAILAPLMQGGSGFLSGNTTLWRWDPGSSKWTRYHDLSFNAALPSQSLWDLSLPNDLLRNTARAALGFDPDGQPAVAYDFQSSGVVAAYLYASGDGNYRSFPTSTVGTGASIANDGLETYFAVRTCGPGDLPFLSVGRLQDGTVPSMTWNNPQECSTLTTAGLPSPALLSMSGRLYLAAGYQVPSGEWKMELFSTSAGTGAQFSTSGGVLQGRDLGLFPGGILNGAALTGQSNPALAATTRGPALVFPESTDPLAPATSRLRAMVFNEATGAFVDPAGSGQTTGLIHPTLPDGSDFDSATAPAIAAIGPTPYVAFIARNTVSSLERVYVAHALAPTGTWVLDVDAANADGALDVEAACSPTTVSITVVDGHPAVSWGESCAIPGQPADPSYQIHSRNEIYVKRLE